MREILAERRTSPYALACLLGLATCRAAAHEAASPRPGDEVLFTFAIFGDNKGGGEAMDASFANMRRMRPSFFVGMGDHFTSVEALKAFDDSIRRAFGGTDVFYRRFYLTPGDNEAGAYAGRQDVLGAERPFFCGHKPRE